MAIIVPKSENPSNTNPPCPVCGHPGATNGESLAVPGARLAYYCTNKNCASEQRPHQWFATLAR